MRLKLWLIFVMLSVVGTPGLVLADEADGWGFSGIRQLTDALRMDLRVLGYGVIQQPSDSSQNPDNGFLRLPHYTANMEFRPDFRLKTDSMDFMAKPRLNLQYQQWEGGPREETSESSSDFYVNEWLARWAARDNLFVSYGRENLQWGPSYLFSPSNPFFLDNGRRNPFEEVPGMDFGRLVWIPDSAWTLSFIANTDKGRNDANLPGPFKKAYALKLDYQGRESYGSLILSHRENSEDSLGAFGGMTVSDALLLYAEGSLVRGVYALYPERKDSYLGASMQRIYGEDNAIQPAILLGGAYTVAAGGTFTGEYAYYGPGYSGSEADLYYALRKRAATLLSLSKPLSGLGQQTLGQIVDTGLRLLRRNYVLLQYNQTNIRDCIDLTFRWTQNMDDGSGQFTALFSYMIGNHLQLFCVATQDAGGVNTEYGSLLDYQWMAGVQYTY